MEKELGEIIDALRITVKEKNLKVSDDNLFEQSCSFLRGRFAGQNKYSGTKGEISKAISKSPSPFPDSNAGHSDKPRLSQKQIKILKKQKFTDEQISKMSFEEVSKNIENYLNFVKKVKSKGVNTI